MSEELSFTKVQLEFVKSLIPKVKAIQPSEVEVEWAPVEGYVSRRSRIAAAELKAKEDAIKEEVNADKV